ncbi:hypothetical protein GCM10010383_08290 [Streptomyces lomondensis]|uniref:Transposase n=1 Tax=Streptomyces lomondensis TaxID=68229 RepID=A0ABQ2WZ31_9ACTN|nr:hypothetical protein GCM10010383_08290 [Streptomyces lomondensis]
MFRAGSQSERPAWPAGSPPARSAFTLPRLGSIRTHEPTSKLLDRIQAGTARILSATVRHERGRWLASFQVETARKITRIARPDAAVGIDLGVRHLAVLVPEWPETRTRLTCRSPVEPTVRPAANAPAGTSAEAGGQMAQACRIRGRRKRETVVRMPTRNSRSGDTATDLSGGNARNAESR